MKFKIGDLVIVKNSYEDCEFRRAPTNRIGKVVTDDIGDRGIEFIEYIQGHSCGRRGKDGHCWYIGVEHLQKIRTNTR